MYVPVFQRVLEKSNQPNPGLLNMLVKLRQEKTSSMLDDGDFEGACLSLRFFGSCIAEEHDLDKVIGS